MLEKPSILLARPQLGENIGAAARAMSNFGLQELRLAAPRDGWPNRKAKEMAAGGESIIDAAKVYPDFISSLEDIELAYSTTARPRHLEKRVVTPDVAMQEISALCKAGRKVALVFGPERTGLENEEIVRCDTLITIPTSSENSSLNLAQSVVILGYEWLKASASEDALPVKDLPAPAPKQDWNGLFKQVEEYLDESGYFRRVPDKRTLMWNNIVTMLQRGAWNDQEIRTLRGMLRSIWERRNTAD